MENQTLSRKHLESLTNQELIIIADDYGLDIPDDLNRRFVIEEILDSVEEIETATESDRTVNFTEDDVALESVLPKTYNETKIWAILRDPVWAYTFWDISSNEITQMEEKDCHLQLRVSFFDDEYETTPKETMDILLANEDRERYIYLSSSRKYFSITLESTVNGKKTDVLASTKRIGIPEKKQNIANLVPGKEMALPSLVKLSGMENIIRRHYVSHRELFENS